MLKRLRVLARKLFPRRTHPLMDTPVATSHDGPLRVAYKAVISGETEPFVLARFEEGIRWRTVVGAYLDHSRRARVLDVGGGNGAVELAFASDDRFLTMSVEYLWNHDAVAVHRAAGLSLRRALADGHALPVRSSSIDVVLCLETIEHVRRGPVVGAEISRVLSDGGLLLITTPPRWRYAFRPDPHFGIRGLVLLPPSAQRYMASRRGYVSPDHYVSRIYSSVADIEGLFPDCYVECVLSRSRAPKRWFWDAILLRRRPRSRVQRPHS